MSKKLTDPFLAPSGLSLAPDAPEIPEPEFLDKFSETFQDDVHSEELLDHLCRGLITRKDLNERLDFLLVSARAQTEHFLSHAEPEGLDHDPHEDFLGAS